MKNEFRARRHANAQRTMRRHFISPAQPLMPRVANNHSGSSQCENTPFSKGDSAGVRLSWLARGQPAADGGAEAGLGADAEGAADRGQPVCHERDELLLGAVVQVPFDPLPFLVLGAGQPPPRRPQVVDGGLQLGSQADVAQYQARAQTRRGRWQSRRCSCPAPSRPGSPIPWASAMTCRAGAAVSATAPAHRRRGDRPPIHPVRPRGWPAPVRRRWPPSP